MVLHMLSTVAFSILAEILLAPVALLQSRPAIRLNAWSLEHVQQMLGHLYGSAFREDAYEDNGEG